MQKFLLKTFVVIALAALVGGAYFNRADLEKLAKRVNPTAQSAQTEKKPDAALATLIKNVHFTPGMTVDLPAAIEEEFVQAEFYGNGREKMSVSLTSKADKSIRLHIPQGLVLQSNSSSVTTTRARDIDLKSGEFRQEELQTVAMTSANQVVKAAYTLTLLDEPKLSPLLKYLGEHSEVSSGAAQTAALALTENLPVSAFSKFAQAGSDIPSKYDTSAFRVEVCDIISALMVLREIGVSDHRLALTIDPQLKIEAMIDPLAHASALRYYGIESKKEWEFWKNYLLNGDESTRHYALYGIARFYPDIALQMLPDWVRESKTNPVYRISAVQALAETQRIEAVSVLRQFQHEFGPLSDIGKAARVAADVLDARLNRNGVGKVAFRAAVKTDVPEL
jgi:hypothetical protein